jgi:hypothetical protein
MYFIVSVFYCVFSCIFLYLIFYLFLLKFDVIVVVKKSVQMTKCANSCQRVFSLLRRQVVLVLRVELQRGGDVKWSMCLI